MPNRILREGILSSERIERLNWAEEVFYRRLMSVVDDYGRYFARPALVLAACYPLLLKKVSDSDIEKWLSACENAALVSVYPASDGKRYLQLLDFKQQVRATASKYPQPPCTCAADAKQVPSRCAVHAHLGVSVFGVVSEGGGGQAPPADFMEVIKGRPELNAAMVYANFRDHYPPDKQTLPRWRKWVAAEHEGKAAPASAADPDSRASIESLAKARNMKPWDEMEPWSKYKARVKETA